MNEEVKQRIATNANIGVEELEKTLSLIFTEEELDKLLGNSKSLEDEIPTDIDEWPENLVG